MRTTQPTIIALIILLYYYWLLLLSQLLPSFVPTHFIPTTLWVRPGHPKNSAKRIFAVQLLCRLDALPLPNKQLQSTRALPCITLFNRPTFSADHGLYPCNDKSGLLLQDYIYFQLAAAGVLASEGWWQAWQLNPQGNQELLVVRDKVGRPPGELGISKSMECHIYSLQCFDTVGWATGRASGL